MESLENRFQRFLEMLPSSEPIIPNRPGIKDGDSEADFFLDERRVVVELKALKEPQRHKGESVIDEYLDHTGIQIFGTLDLSRVARSEEHLAALERTIFRRTTRCIERICRSADKQIGGEFSRLPHLSTGLLVLLNESVEDLHPRQVADRVVDYARSRGKITNFHYCLLVFESHRASINGRFLPYPILIDLTYSARQRRVRSYLEKLKDSWARQNGFPYGLPSPEPEELAYVPDSITFGH